MALPQHVVDARRDLCRACPQALRSDKARFAAAAGLTTRSLCSIDGANIAAATGEAIAECPTGRWWRQEPLPDLHWCPRLYPDGRCVITGCDQEQEWALPFWWANYHRHNALPVVFADFGLSSTMRAWCEDRGEVIHLPGSENAMWRKPQAVLNCPYGQIAWMDVDCQVHGNIEMLFAGAGLSLRRDHAWALQHIAPDMVQAGVLVCRHGESIVLDWARWCAVGTRVTGYLDDKLQVRDQLLLTWLLRRQKPPVAPLDHRWDWLFFEPALTTSPVITHWAGTEGKQALAGLVEQHNAPVHHSGLVLPRWQHGEPRRMVNDTEWAFLRELAYRVARPGAVLVELGSYLGGTSARLAQICRRTGAKLACVDLWQWCDGGDATRVYDAFLANMADAGVADAVQTLRMDTTEAAGQFADGSVDMIFIDSDHSHETTRREILAWRPKLRPDGILCGHDYNNRFGVKQAVDELIGEHVRVSGTLWGHCQSPIGRPTADRHRA